MKTIRQHGESSELFDINQFLPILERNLEIEEWEIRVEWCSGKRSSEIEKSANSPIVLVHEKFKEMYEGIFQTIDGEFKVYAKEGSVILLAFDSSYWQVRSNVPGVEDEFEKTFGLYSYYSKLP